MVVGNYQCNAANLNQSEAQFQLELSLAQLSPSLLQHFINPRVERSLSLENKDYSPGMHSPGTFICHLWRTKTFSQGHP